MGERGQAGWGVEVAASGSWPVACKQHLHRVTVLRLHEEPGAVPLQGKSRRRGGCNAFPTSWLHLSQPPSVTAEGLFVVLQPADLGIKNGV